MRPESGEWSDKFKQGNNFFSGRWLSMWGGNAFNKISFAKEFKAITATGSRLILYFVYMPMKALLPGLGGWVHAAAATAAKM